MPLPTTAGGNTGNVNGTGNGHRSPSSPHHSGLPPPPSSTSNGANNGGNMGKEHRSLSSIQTYRWIDFIAKIKDI